jgi:Na+-transporting NADH:ubiquinone oxidoreductase subunit C
MGDAFVIDVIKENAKVEADRQLPLYVAEVDGQLSTLSLMRGAGLWGPIWGYIALNDDKNTVFGTIFRMPVKTLVWELKFATPKFQKEFAGKHILNDARDFVSIAVMKPGQIAEGQDYVDGISGGTITSKGVEAMLLKSIGQYEAYLKN